MRSAGTVLVTATSVTWPGSRPGPAPRRCHAAARTLAHGLATGDRAIGAAWLRPQHIDRTREISVQSAHRASSFPRTRIQRHMAARTLRRARSRAELAGGLGERDIFKTPEATTRDRNTTSGDVPLSLRAASIWAMCATTPWATSSPATCAPAASTCCIRWAGTRSACRPKTPRCRTRRIRAKWTYDNIATMRGAAQIDGPVARLVARARHLRPELLPPPAALFLDLLDAGLVDRKTAQGQLGPGRPDGARQRAGDRRPRLALRRARSSSAS